MSKAQVCHEKDDSIKSLVSKNIRLVQQDQESIEDKESPIDEFSHGHCITNSHSSNELRPIDESKRKGGTGRSKSSLDEASYLKSSFMQQGLTESERITYGSHGDGLLHDQNSDTKR